MSDKEIARYLEEAADCTKEAEICAKKGCPQRSESWTEAAKHWANQAERINKEKEKYPRKYESITDNSTRLKVPGGWIYITFWQNQSHSSLSLSTCFIPDPNHEWELEPEKENKR